MSSGLALLAAAPGAPLTTMRSRATAANRSYVSSLQLLLGLRAIVVTPLTLSLFEALFALPIGRVSPMTVVGQVAEVAFLPAVLGLALRSFARKIAARVEKAVRILSDALFLVMALSLAALILFLPAVRANLLAGRRAFAAIGLLAFVAVVGGHLLAGLRPDHRGGLAIASVARNVGLALFLSGLVEAHAEEIARTVMACMVVGFLVALPYSFWIRRQISSSPRCDVPVRARARPMRCRGSLEGEACRHGR